MGQNTQYNGDGFAKQKFQMLAVTQPAFDRFIARGQRAPKRLDAAHYAALTKRSTIDTPQLLSAVPPGLFERIVMQGMRTSGASQ